jgi:hypothetical protein
MMLSQLSLEKDPATSLPSMENDERIRAAVEAHSDHGTDQYPSAIRFRHLSHVSTDFPSVLKLWEPQSGIDEAIVVVPSIIAEDVTNGLRAQMSFLNETVLPNMSVFAFLQDPYNVQHPEAFAEAAVEFLSKEKIDAVDIVAIEDGSIAAAKIAQHSGSIAVTSATFINPPNVRERSSDDIYNAYTEYPSEKALKSALREYRLEHLSDLYPSARSLPFLRRKQAASLAHARFSYIAKNPKGREYLNHLAVPSLDADLAAIKGTHRVIVRGQLADIAPTFDTIKKENAERRIEVPGVGRELMLPMFVAQAVRLATKN